MSVKSDKVFSKNHLHLGVLLESVGFSSTEEGEYFRHDLTGKDRAFIDTEPSKGRFSIMLSFYPKPLQVVEDLYQKTDEPRGFPVGPYLTKVSVGRRPYWWSCKTVEILTASCEKVATAMSQHGLPWLNSLRDPKVFAREVDPNGALYAGYAHELAGDFLAARDRYEDMRERLTEVNRMKISEEKFLNSYGKGFVFVSQKLGMIDSEVERLRTILAMPEIEPLPS